MLPVSSEERDFAKLGLIRAYIGWLKHLELVQTQAPDAVSSALSAEEQMQKALNEIQRRKSRPLNKRPDTSDTVSEGNE